MSCDDFRSRLDQFLSAELSEPERSEIEAHLARCSSCRAEEAALRQWKQLIASAGKRYAPDTQFRKKILKRYKATVPFGRWFSIRATLPACTVFVLAVLLATGYRITLARKNVFAEIVDQHSASVSTGVSLDVASADYRTIESWFRGKLRFNLRIPDLKNTPFSIVGARLVFLNQTPGAQLIFASQTGQISAFVFPESEPLRRSFHENDVVAHRAPFNVEVCGTKRFLYVVVGEVNSAAIHQLVDLMETSN